MWKWLLSKKVDNMIKDIDFYYNGDLLCSRKRTVYDNIIPRKWETIALGEDMYSVYDIVHDYNTGSINIIVCDLQSKKGV